MRRFGQRLDGFEGAMRAMVQESIQVQGNLVFEAVESVKKDTRASLQEQGQVLYGLMEEVKRSSVDRCAIISSEMSHLQRASSRSMDQSKRSIVFPIHTVQEEHPVS